MAKPKWTPEPDGFGYYWRIKGADKSPIIVQCHSAVGDGYLYLKIEDPKLPTKTDWKKVEND